MLLRVGLQTRRLDALQSSPHCPKKSHVHRATDGLADEKLDRRVREGKTAGRDEPHE